MKCVPDLPLKLPQLTPQTKGTLSYLFQVPFEVLGEHRCLASMMSHFRNTLSLDIQIFLKDTRMIIPLSGCSGILPNPSSINRHQQNFCFFSSCICLHVFCPYETFLQIFLEKTMGNSEKQLLKRTMAGLPIDGTNCHFWLRPMTPGPSKKKRKIPWKTNMAVAGKSHHEWMIDVISYWKIKVEFSSHRHVSELMGVVKSSHGSKSSPLYQVPSSGTKKNGGVRGGRGGGIYTTQKIEVWLVVESVGVGDLEGFGVEDTLPETNS